MNPISAFILSSIAGYISFSLILKGNRQPKPEEAQENKRDGQSSIISEDTLSIDNACKVLGVTYPLSGTELHAAYKARITEYHPDKVANLGFELRQLANQKTMEIIEAYNFLKPYST